MRKLLIGVASGLMLVVLSASAVVIHARREPAPLRMTPRAHSDVRAPDDVRIRVQVLNTTKTRGLARRATRLLRDRGFDVVEIGTVGPTIDTTVVLDLSGHPDWAASVAKVMAPARTRARRDSSRYLDVTVLVGSTWRPPAEPLYP
ncbi:MAG TPA: LytR C-terminal domain-containing protein [Gemmatimonadaceae bacterium]|nr:LytR C-terminal domain-containing protein [Gemmatimonadaceae bacterium]